VGTSLGIETNVAGLPRGCKRNDDAFYTNGAIAVLPMAKKEPDSHFIIVEFNVPLDVKSV